MAPCGACAKAKLAGILVAPNAPDCPNPSRTMRLRGASWSQTCDCAGCTERRSSASKTPWDVDDTAVERVVHGWPSPGLNKAERLEVTRRLTSRGVSAREIARVIRKTPRTVVRYRTELRMESE